MTYNPKPLTPLRGALVTQSRELPRYVVVALNDKPEIVGMCASEGDAQSLARDKAAQAGGTAFAVFQNIGQALLVPKVEWTGAGL